MDRIGGVETETIEMKLVDPIASVGDVVFPDRRRVGSIEVN